jgi:hypothetical protein
MLNIFLLAVEQVLRAEQVGLITAQVAQVVY